MVLVFSCTVGVRARKANPARVETGASNSAEAEITTQQSLRKSVTIKLAGHTLNLRTEDEPEYVNALADHLADRIEMIRDAAGSASAHHVALLAGLRVVDELFKANESLATLEQKVVQRVGHVVDLLDEASTE